jgi:hypothetical protein
MKYNELTATFTRFHLGEATKTELTFAIAMWQRAGAML